MVCSSAMEQQGESGGILKMDKLLEEFLMPPPESAQASIVRTSTDSLRDASSSSLDRSNNSSTSSSWNSSCSCHSMSAQSYNTKSAFVFHKQPILPPLLCSSSRNEMKIYKMKALEKERHRKEREKARLISRVEAILSSVELSPKKKISDVSKSAPDNFPPLEEEESIHSSQSESTDHDSARTSDRKPIEVKQDSNEADINDAVDGNHDNQGCFHGDNKDFCDEQSSDDDNFQNEAYRSSLRNLLQKSLSMGQSLTPDRKQKNSSLSSKSNSSSETEEDITENTVVNAKPTEKQFMEDLEANEQSLQTSPEKFADLPNDEEETLVQSIVEMAISDAKNHIVNESSNLSTHELEIVQEGHEIEVTCIKTLNNNNVTSWETPRTHNKENCDQKSPTTISPLLNEFHNQSTSTKVNMVDENGLTVQDNGNNFVEKFQESPILPQNEVVELSGEICFNSTIVGADEVIKTNPVVMATAEVSNEDLTLLQPVMSDTVSDATGVTSSEQCSDDMKENRDPTMETGSLLSLKRSLSFTLDRPSQILESAVVEAVSNHFQGYKNNEDNDNGPTTPTDGFEQAKKQELLRTRVRRGSYTLDEPSPCLLKNKESLTIEPEDEVCSETTSNNQNDVKRKLDIESDSEESSVRESIKGIKQTKGSVSRAELNVVNLYKLLQDQHKQQMKSMKKRHEEQLATLQSELVSGKCDVNSPVKKRSNSMKDFIPPSDVTVSPSLASTEYKDIQIGAGCYRNANAKSGPQICNVNYHNNIDISTNYEHHLVEYRSNEIGDCYQSAADISRVTDVVMTTSLHVKLCKLSALCKGYLTRRLMASSKVEEIMQLIRETSMLILSLRGEIDESKGMDSVRDTYLEDRLITQLRAAMQQFHDIFFNISTSDRMYIIAQSSISNRRPLKKTSQPHKLSAATQKSLERKRLLSTNSDTPIQPLSHKAKVAPKEVKSKISHIWKSESAKPTAHTIAVPKKDTKRNPSGPSYTRSKTKSPSAKLSSAQPKTTSLQKKPSALPKSKSPLQSKDDNLRPIPNANKRVIAQKKTAAVQSGKSSNSKLQSKNKKSVPLIKK